MGKGIYISKVVAVVGGIVAVGAVATIIALSVVYSQELAKNDQNSPQPTGEIPTTGPSGPTTAAPSNQPWDQYRLPKNLVPLSYKVTLWPRLTPDNTTGLYIFTGTTTVEFECVEETDLILIHSNKLNYTTLDNGQSATLQSLNGGTTPSIKSSWLQTTTQYLVLELDAKLQKGRYSLYTKFTGELADDLGGFYRSEYKDGERPKVIATTQMQPTDARKAFPCFDEPAMKAIFNITILHDNNTIALSNGQEIESKEVLHDNQTLLQTVFEPTVKMSTYLLAFIVSEFGYVEDTSSAVKVRIYARQAAINAGQGDYAKNITGPILKHFEDYFSIPYPLSKSDQIALPDFNAGAMENWGLITYRETALLYDEEYSSNSNKERIATIIGHELAHMWFGNLVTLRWWNDLWLNEGFASYIEYEGADSAEPDWGVKDLIVLGDVHRVFAVDALTSSHPLSSKEEDIQRPAQISELFDAISYSKGASVLRMLSDFLSEDIFKKGLTSYLKQFEYGDAVYQDLWDHLQEAADNSSLSLNVTGIMNTWVLQMGFPVVTINTTTGEVSQKHFLLDPEANVTTPSPYNYEWSVPIRWNINEENQEMMWLHNKSENNPNFTTKEDQWVLANVNLVGYYRVNYDESNWIKLVNALRNSHLSIPVINRAQLIDDAFNLARAKIIPTVRALETTEYLGKERAYIPWKSAMNNLEYFDLMFDRSEVYGPLQDYLQTLVKPVYEYYEGLTANWTKVPGGHMDQYNQINAISLACKTGLPDCLALTQKLFNDWMTTGNNTIHPNLRSTVYCNAIAAGGAAEWNFAWEQFKNMTIATEAEKIRAALACTKEPWLLNRYLEYTLDPNFIRKQDATSTIVYIASNVIGQSLAWDFVRARWSYIYTQYGGGSFSFSNLVNGVTERFSTDYELTQLLAFKNDNADVGFGSGTLAVEQSIERTIGNMKWLEENKQNVLTWLESKNGGDGAAPWKRYRLPTDLVPNYYNVTLWPRLSSDPNTGLYIFTGQSTVTFDCVKETDLILIHSNKLNYTILDSSHIVRLRDSDGEVGVSVPTVKYTWLESKTQYLVIQLTSKLTQGRTYQLYTEFTGELADDLSGFYRSEYKEDGVQKIVATSQMHPTHARKTFPCFDEPSMKAVFFITVLHPPGTVALSNGMETDIVNTTIDEVSVTMTTFEPTKKMSTYLLAIVVSDYAHIRNVQEDILIRIWARKTTVDHGQANYALNVTGPVLQFFQSYYNVSYPLTKSDQIALPDFYFGAMENWGLVTYRETNLLYDPLTSSNGNKETTATIIAHELAHMWFGNLVTQYWWNEVWLNEGFATYVSYLGADHAEPEWNVKDLIVLDDIHRAFAVDALTSSHPLSSKEDGIFLPEQISEQFDTIAYSKGAAVLRMVSDFLSEPVFVQGLSSYLKYFAYGSTVGDDLWKHLQVAVSANEVSLPGQVSEIMNHWIYQMGYPVVTINTQTGQVSQNQFLLDPEARVTQEASYEWMIPVRWMKSSELQSMWWLIEKEVVNMAMISGDSWILANINVTGFYRVNYDLGNWERLIAQLNADHKVLPLINRAQLVDDAFNLARAQLVPTTLALRTTTYLSEETEYLPWQSAINNLQYYHKMLDRTEVYQPMQDYLNKLVTPLYLHFKILTSNWTDVPIKHTDQYNQVNIIRTACNTGVAECQNLTKTWFKQWMGSPQHNPIHPNLRSAVYCSAIATGGEEEWEFGWSQFKSSTLASEASKLMSALACTTKTLLLDRYLSYTLNSTMIRKQDATSVITAVASNRDGQDLAWNFVQEHWEYMFTDYGVGSFSFASLINGVTERFSTQAELQQLEEFVKDHGVAGFGSATLAVEQSLERTKANIKWVQRNEKEIFEWLKSQVKLHANGKHESFPV